MRIVIFGLAVSSSWGNGHATLWRSLIGALLDRGHTVLFYEKDVPYYASQRDLTQLPPGGELRLYESFAEIRQQARVAADGADLALCTSYCPDGALACELVLNSRAAVRAFYDLDTPVTLDVLSSGGHVPYLPAAGLSGFDVVLSYTGGQALAELQSQLGARQVATLYGWADPAGYRPVAAVPELRNTLSYLGTYAADRQSALQRLLLEPAAQREDAWFLIGGAQYPADFPWRSNIGFLRHVPPLMHPAFFSSSRATLNVTRQTMARFGFCPSGRLFEATACGVALISDYFEGLETFFELGTEMLRVDTAGDVLQALALSDAELDRIAAAGRERTLSQHTAAHRARELEAICERVAAGSSEFMAPVTGAA